MSSEITDGKEFRRSRMENTQGLLPGIPDHLTIQNIAPKLTWETCNPMQMVSRKWRHAVDSRSVYDARVLSQSTESFLVLHSKIQWGKAVLILYSCKYGTSLLLPPIPVAEKICSCACICLDGRVYLFTANSDVRSKRDLWSVRCRTELWVLDLAGKRLWEKHGRVTCSPFTGVLDGKIFDYSGNSRPSPVSVLDAHGIWRQPNEPHIRSKVRELPNAQVYDPQSRIWSAITPKSFRNSFRSILAASEAHLEHHLAAFYEWEKERPQTDPSLIVGPYEPFYSEWGSRLSTKLTRDNVAMAPQVYHGNLFFIQEKLVRLVPRTGGMYDLQTFDTQKNVWEHRQSLLAPCGGDIYISSPVFADNIYIWSSVFADNVIWAFMQGHHEEAVLVRSTPFLNGEADGHSARWIVTNVSGRPPYDSSFIRPIYL